MNGNEFAKKMAVVLTDKLKTEMGVRLGFLPERAVEHDVVRSRGEAETIHVLPRHYDSLAHIREVLRHQQEVCLLYTSDRLILLPDGKCGFVAVKASGGKPRPLQAVSYTHLKNEYHDHIELFCELIKLCHIHLPRIFFEWVGGSGDCRPVLSQER